ncbi:uncharacterized protein LOC107405131 [Ziziphus jujuba]|uniref:Uncharacterized protein LOC107405131 n=1 Tax=Ziziphus jujuba TaxID=326968 RepID=A0ABM4A7H4_ZIZJJ|nr:uncharacterized protein LOC107405131 [Ziziphus jujuba]
MAAHGLPDKFVVWQPMDHCSRFMHAEYYNRTFNVALDANERFQILQEQDEGVIFLLNNSSELLGNLLTVSCIWHRSFSGFFYDIVAKSQGNSLRLQSFTECTKRRSNSILVTTGFLLVPQNFRNSSNELKLELCIWSKDSFPTNF